MNKLFRFGLKKLFKYKQQDLYTVVIPTIWVPEKEFIFALISDLNECPNVGEILLIDNAPEKQIEIPFFSKLKYLKQKENIYVNPAWNLGVQNAKYNKIILCNDDINTDWSILDHINQLYHESWSNNIGLLGIDGSCLDCHEKNLSFRFTRTRNIGYGCLMIFKKDIYTEIPNIIKIYSGDCFLFENALSLGKINMAIIGWQVQMASKKMSLSSSKPEFEKIKQTDVESYKALGEFMVANNASLINASIIDLLRKNNHLLQELKKNANLTDKVFSKDFEDKKLVKYLESNKKFDNQKSNTFSLLNNKSFRYTFLSRRDIYSLFDKVPQKVIDVGCATGGVGKGLKENYENVFVVGFEPNLEAYEQANKFLDCVFKTTLSESKKEGLDFLKQADTVLFLDVLEHMYDPWQELKFLANHISKDCQVIVSLPNVGHIRVIADLINGSWRYTPSGQLDITHIRFFTEYEMYKMFYQTGFKVEKKKYLRTMEGFENLDSENVPAKFPVTVKINDFEITVKDKDHWMQLNSVLIAFRLRLADDLELNDRELDLRSASHVSTFVV